MKNISIFKRSTFVTALLVMFTFTGVTFISCKKSSTPDNAKFIGSWTGNDCNTSGVTYTFSAGSSNSSINFQYDFDLAQGCDKYVIINATTNGNNFTIPSQTFTDNCGNTAAASGAGYVNGNTLTATLTLANGNGSYTCQFQGTK